MVIYSSTEYIIITHFAPDITQGNEINWCKNFWPYSPGTEFGGRNEHIVIHVSWVSDF